MKKVTKGEICTDKNLSKEVKQEIRKIYKDNSFELKLFSHKTSLFKEEVEEELENIVEKLIDNDYFDNYLNEKYKDINLLDSSYSPSYALKTLNKEKYNSIKSEYKNDILNSKKTDLNNDMLDKTTIYNDKYKWEINKQSNGLYEIITYRIDFEKVIATILEELANKYNEGISRISNHKDFWNIIYVPKDDNILVNSYNYFTSCMYHKDIYFENRKVVEAIIDIIGSDNLAKYYYNFNN